MVNAQGLTGEELLKRYDPDKCAVNNPAVTVDMLLFALRDEKKASSAEILKMNT